jgi:hypothetical protein
MTHDTLHITQTSRSREWGAALLATFLLMLVLSGLALAVGMFGHNSVVGGKTQLLDKQAFYVAEAGWQRARQAINAGTWTAAQPANVFSESFGAGEYEVSLLENPDDTYTITSEGYVPNDTSPVAQRRVRESDIPVTGAGTNLSLTATALASSSSGSNTPNKANDGSTGTRWESGTNGSGSWLAMDHASATTMDKIVVEEHNFINGLTIEWSDDYSSWTVASGLSVVESPTKTWTATFTSTAHRYFRARFTSVPSSKAAAVSEMESYNTNAATTLGTGSVTTAW